MTVGFGLTGLHVIHIMEYCRAHDIELDHLMTPESPATERTLQWVRKASRALGAPDATVAEMHYTRERMSLDRDFAMFDAMVADDRRPVRIVSGSLHLPFVWFLLERYRDRIDSVVLVDEGLSTYAGPEGDRNKVSKIVQNIQQPEIERAYRAFVDFPATYYSRFPLLKQLGPHDSFEPVDRSVLPHLLKYDDVPTAPCIYFIGQPLRHLIAEPALDAAMTSLAVHITRRLHPGSEVVYIPHRRRPAREAPDHQDRGRRARPRSSDRAGRTRRRGRATPAGHVLQRRGHLPRYGRR